MAKANYIEVTSKETGAKLNINADKIIFVGPLMEGSSENHVVIPGAYIDVGNGSIHTKESPAEVMQLIFAFD